MKVRKKLRMKKIAFPCLLLYVVLSSLVVVGKSSTGHCTAPRRHDPITLVLHPSLICKTAGMLQTRPATLNNRHRGMESCNVLNIDNTPEGCRAIELPWVNTRLCVRERDCGRPGC